MVGRLSVTILFVSQYLFHLVIFLTPLVLFLGIILQEVLFHIVFISHARSWQYVLSIQILLYQLCHHRGMQSLLSGSYFFYLVLKRHLPVSHEFHGQSGQKNLIQMYIFCSQLMPLACAP